MKIPKYIDNLISRRERLAYELEDACRALEEWLEKNGWDDLLSGDDLMEDTHGGVEIYCNPSESAKRIRKYIEENL